MGRLFNGTVTDNVQNKEIERQRNVDLELSNGVNKLSDSLNEQGLLNVFDGLWTQGNVNGDGTTGSLASSVRNTNQIYCNSGDYVRVKTTDTPTRIDVAIFNSSGTFLQFVSTTNSNEFTFTVTDSTASYFIFDIRYGSAITPSEMKKTTVFINNSIDELKADLFNQIITSLTPASDTTNIVAGGYSKIGNLCIVNLRFNRSATTLGTVAKNLPKPISATSNYVGATVKDIGTDSQSDGYGYVSNDGDAIVKVQKASSDYTFCAVYICQ